MATLHAKNFTKEQLAKLWARGMANSYVGSKTIAYGELVRVHAQEGKALRRKQGGRRWAKRYVHGHGGDGTAGELDAILLDVLRSPDLDEIKRLAREVPPLPPRHHPEPPADPWLRCAQIVCDDPPGTGCDEFPGSLDKSDVPEEWWWDARSWAYTPSPESVAHRAKGFAPVTTAVTGTVTDYREICRRMYGYLVATSWMAEQAKRQQALQAAEELTNDLDDLLADLQELRRLETESEHDNVFLIYENTLGSSIIEAEGDGKEPIEMDEWTKLHDARKRLRFLRGFRELVLQAEKYEPANEQVEKLLKS